MSQLTVLISAKTSVVSDSDSPHSLFDNTYTIVVKPLWSTADKVVFLYSLIARFEVRS